MAELRPDLLLPGVEPIPLEVPVLGGDDRIVRMLAEVRVCELLAADLHVRHGDRLSM
jgi:hypothetical protein